MRIWIDCLWGTNNFVLGAKLEDKRAKWIKKGVVCVCIGVE